MYLYQTLMREEMFLQDHKEMSMAYRPSHADFTYDTKYGVREVQGGGRSSARETIGRVIPGAIAKKILKQFSGTEVLACLTSSSGCASRWLG
ncbi:chorismate synthase, chloroplastic-like [Hibiscus syriacus]|uniref:chorismate synthase, chloroplastic-like n=1 Tax=Hibiscus syriacus TaxID=106335 RepID=UPI00192454A4|nr:chorismate synthase, chloroplastic-like [Hibiscus syriacus]